MSDDYRVSDRENVTLNGRPMTAFGLYESRPHPIQNRCHVHIGRFAAEGTTPPTTPASERRWRRSTEVPTMTDQRDTYRAHAAERSTAAIRDERIRTALEVVHDHQLLSSHLREFDAETLPDLAGAFDHWREVIEAEAERRAAEEATP